MKEINHREYKKLGVRIAYFRRMRDLSQQEVANVLNTEASYVSKVERGTVGMTLDMLFAYANALGVQAWQLLDFRDMD